jgi:hypothetical protein
VGFFREWDFPEPQNNAIDKKGIARDHPLRLATSQAMDLRQVSTQYTQLRKYVQLASSAQAWDPAR